MAEEMSEQDIKNQIIKLYNSKEYIELSSYYSYKNYFEILKVARNENTHSNFIAWLLNPLENHGLGTFALYRFFLLLIHAKDFPCNRNSRFDDNLSSDILANNIDIEKIEIERERAIDGKKRLDILISATIKNGGGGKDKILPIILENKVNSTENKYYGKGQTQTEIYYEWAQNEFVPKKEYFEPVYVFLAPFRNSEIKKNENLEDKPKCDKYITINYQLLNDYVLEPCQKNKPTEAAKTLIDNYQRCLSYSECFGDDYENSNKKKTSDKGVKIMATNEEQKKLLRNFWDKNKNLLNAALSALADDPDILENEKNAFSKAYKTISNRDNTQYLFNGKTFGKGPLVLAVIKDYVRKNPDISYAGVDKAFDKAWNKKTCIIHTKDIKDKTRYFPETISIEGEDVSVSNQWKIDNISPFIAAAEKLGYRITALQNYNS